MPKKPAKPKGHEVSAKAEATAKVSASISRRRTHRVTETIPEDVTRAKSKAWLDVVSPVREWLGLKGDLLRHRREDLAIQREVTLLEIARRFSAARLPGSPLPVLPPKFLVPYIDQASLEEPDSPLVELWANLLISAAEDYDGQYLHFSRLIAGLSPRQAELFRDNFTASDLHKTELSQDDIQGFFEQSHIEKALNHQLERFEPLDDDQFCECIIEFFNHSGITIVHSAFVSETGDFDLGFPYRVADDVDEVDYAILIALGLIARVSTDQMEFMEKWALSIIYYHLTPLGFTFAKACKIRPPGEEPEID